MSAARRQVAEYVAHVARRRRDFDLVERLEQHRLALRRDRFEREDAGHLERHFVRVDGVVRAVEHLDLEVHQRIPGDDAAYGRLLDSPVDRRNVLSRNRATDDLVDELIARPARQRGETHPAIAELTAAPGLFLVASLPFSLSFERLAV